MTNTHINHIYIYIKRENKCKYNKTSETSKNNNIYNKIFIGAIFDINIQNIKVNEVQFKYIQISLKYKLICFI